MFFKGTLSVDPSQLTRIEKIAPTKIFKKMLYLLTAGMASRKTEHETFCAVSILQQINAAMRTAGINNIIRLAKDDLDLYFDKRGRKDDFEKAIERFTLETDSLEAAVFESLYLVLEHEDPHFRYLIEITINRSHAVGEYPIFIEVNAVVREFEMGKGADPPERMNELFTSQKQYDAFHTWKRNYFITFLRSLGRCIKTQIHVDDIVTRESMTIIRPLPAKTGQKCKRGHIRNSPIFHGYYGWEDALNYALLWARKCHTHSILLKDFQVVDDTGRVLANVGSKGISAGEVETMNPETRSSLPEGVEVASAQPPGLVPDIEKTGNSGGSFFGFSGNSSDHGISVDSCSSCAGGCGGCGAV